MFKTNPIKSTCVKKDNRKPVNSMARSYLQPEYDSRASFYNKAETDDDKLYSYGTLVAEIIDGKPVLYDDWDYSQTTIRHVREFLRQHGFNAESKSQIARDYLTNSRKAIKSDNSRHPVKSGKGNSWSNVPDPNADWNEVHSFIENNYYERIRMDLDDLIYSYQQELGIMTGDTQVEIDPAIDTVIDILTDQYGNR